MSWYYVDASGQTQGGFEVSVMKQKYASKEMTDESYVWNGTSVNQWTPLKQVPELLNQVKPSPAAASARPARRKSPLGGGGRANFLASIQKGAQLKKVEPKKESDKPSGGGGGGGGGAKKGGFGGGMDLMSQLKAKQNAMKSGGKIKSGGGPKPGGGAKKTWGKKPATSSAPKSTGSAAPKKTWGKTTTTSANKSYGGGGSNSTRITRIKNKLDSADDWQLKAIEKILS